MKLTRCQYNDVGASSLSDYSGTNMLKLAWCLFWVGWIGYLSGLFTVNCASVPFRVNHPYFTYYYPLYGVPIGALSIVLSFFVGLMAPRPQRRTFMLVHLAIFGTLAAWLWCDNISDIRRGRYNH